MPELMISRGYGKQESDEIPEYIPDREELERITDIDRKYSEKDTHKRSFEKTWFVTGAFIRGQHYVSYNEVTQNFEVPFKVPRGRVRLTVNLCMAYFRRTRARLTAKKPTVLTRPATTDQSDVERSRLNTKVLESEFYRMDFQSTLRRIVSWSLEAGSGIGYLSWNPRAGQPLTEQQPVIDQETGQPQVDPETGQPAMEEVPLTDESGTQLYTGENEIQDLTPYEIDVDPMATGLHDAQWIMRNKIRTLGWIKDHYPEKGQYVKREDVFTHSYYEKRIRQMVGTLGYSSDADSGEGSSDADQESAVVHEYWEGKSFKFPRGRLIITANKVELFNGDNPYEHQLLPFFKIDEIEVGGRFWGQAVLEHLIQLQKNYNRARSQEVENRTLMGRPKWLVPRTAKVQQSSFDAEAGEKIVYQPGPRGERPEMIAPPPTHQSTQIEISHTMSDIQEVGSFHEVSRGILPSANIPGIAVDKLQQADETSLGDTARSIDLAVIRLGQMLLSNCAQFWDEERLVRAGGEGSRLEAMRIRGADLQGEDPSANYFDVRVIPGSTLLKDPQKAREQVQHLIEIGVLDPIQNRDIILKMMDIGDIEAAFEADRQDEQYAEKENEMMQAGQFPQPRDFENHAIHIMVADKFRKSEKYRQLPPPFQQLFDLHVQGHKELLVAVGQEQAMMQLMVQSVLEPQEEEAAAVPAGAGSQKQEG